VAGDPGFGQGERRHVQADFHANQFVRALS
jgi:hypothetical protein